jgi:HlyD family secretion protein
MSLSSDVSRGEAGGNVVKFPGAQSATSAGWRKVFLQTARSVWSGVKGHGTTLCAIALVVIVISLGLWSFSAASLPRYTTVPAARGAMVRAVTATGTVEPAQTVVVSAAVSGIVQNLSCGVDSEVKAGQVCAKLDPRPYQAVLDQYSAQLLRDRAILEKDRAELARLRRHAQGAPSAHSQIAEQDLVVSGDEATVKLDQALLQSARLNLGYTDIIAPADGTVTARKVSAGEAVAANASTLFVIAADPRHVDIDVDAVPNAGSTIQRGAVATITVEGLPNRVFHGVVNRVRRSPPSGQAPPTYNAAITVDNTDLMLKPDMVASAQIIIEQRNDVLRVPDQALQFTPSAAKVQAGSAAGEGRPQIWLLRGNAPVAVSVTTGLDDGKFTEIAQGEIEPGDQVIIGENKPQPQPVLTAAP